MTGFSWETKATVVLTMWRAASQPEKPAGGGKEVVPALPPCSWSSDSQVGKASPREPRHGFLPTGVKTDAESSRSLPGRSLARGPGDSGPGSLGVTSLSLLSSLGRRPFPTKFSSIHSTHVSGAPSLCWFHDNYR